MKVLFRKLKRTNKFALTTFLVTFVAYIIGLVLFSKSLLSLSGIETFLRIIAIVFFGIWIFIYLITSLVKLIKRNYKIFIPFTILTLLFSIVFFIGSYYIDFFYDKVGGLSESNTITYTSNLINFKDSEFNSKSIIGMISDEEDIEGNILANKIVKKHSLKNKIKKYDDYQEMLYDFYNNKIDAIFVSANYATLFGSDENYGTIGNDTKIIYKFSEERKNEDLDIVSNKKLTEPFTVLVMGVDSDVDGLNANAAFNGDTLIMMTFNPKTLTASMFSIPRDTYVPIACRNNAYSKINSSAAYGTNCVIDTIEQLTDINIDYYVKVNFKAVVDLVDAVGGIELEIEEPDFVWNHGVNCGGKICEATSNRSSDKMVYIDPGWQKLNGEQALGYARCRHLYIESDLARNRHQQELISALAAKAMTIRDFKEFENILDAVSNNIATNMSTKQILSSYEILKSMLEKSLNGEEMITIKKTYLEVYNLPVNTGYTITSALGYYPSSLEEITKMMKVNLELEEEETIKTFSYSVNEDYSSKIYGKGKTSGGKLETLPNFVGKSVSEVQSWGSKNGISIIIKGEGSIVETQNKAAGMLVKNISSLTITTRSNYSVDTEKETESIEENNNEESTEN
ncbi:MAG: LCP family protein [Bacilli bacterium]|nr:LCP family protein [Bacilli bacterium]